MKENSQFIWKLWDLANVITGFVAAQAMVWAFAFKSKDFVDKIYENGTVTVIACLVIILAHLIFAFGAYWCYKRSIKLNRILNKKAEKEDLVIFEKTWKTSNTGRLITILFFFIFALIMLFGTYKGVYKNENETINESRAIIENIT